jgi:hypothetical protein
VRPSIIFQVEAIALGHGCGVPLPFKQVGSGDSLERGIGLRDPHPLDTGKKRTNPATIPVDVFSQHLERVVIAPLYDESEGIWKPRAAIRTGRHYRAASCGA